MVRKQVNVIKTEMNALTKPSKGDIEQLREPLIETRTKSWHNQ